MFDNGWLWRRFGHDSEYWPLGLTIKLFFKSFLDTTLNRGCLIDNRFPLFKYQKKIIRSLEPKEGAFNMDKFYHGFYPYSGIRNLSPVEVEAKFNQLQVNTFKTLLTLFAEQGIQVILVQTPEFLKGRVIKSDHDKHLLQKIADTHQ